jgi:4-amino-4-deoxy-L-arabinose transferase-like glycosyltransferase
LASTKLPNYIIPLYPALALATALFVERWTTAAATIPRWWLLISFSILTTVGVMMLIALPTAAELLAQPDWTIGLVGLAPLVGGMVGLVLVCRSQFVRAAQSLAVTAVVLVVWLFGQTAVEADRFQTADEFVDMIHQVGGGQETVASFEYFRPTMVYYGQHPVATLKQPQDVADFFREHPQGAFLYTLDEKLPKLADALPPEVTVLMEHRRLFKSGKVLLFGRKSDVARQSDANIPRR